MEDLPPDTGEGTAGGSSLLQVATPGMVVSYHLVADEVNNQVIQVWLICLLCKLWLLLCWLTLKCVFNARRGTRLPIPFRTKKNVSVCENLFQLVIINIQDRFLHSGDRSNWSTKIRIVKPLFCSLQTILLFLIMLSSARFALLCVGFIYGWWFPAPSMAAVISLQLIQQTLATALENAVIKH